jgi:hypothetical protein
VKEKGVQLFSLLAALHNSHEMQLDKKYATKPNTRKQVKHQTSKD